MNRTDRLLAIVLELQRHGQRRAEDLAAIFGTSKRTIYRDIEALSQSGVPIAAMTGQGYSLMEGYFLPPLMFTADEATMLLLGADAMAQNFDAQYRAAAQSAAAKIDGALSERRRAEVRYLQSSLFFHQNSAVANPRVSNALQQLRRAVIERRQVRFRYFARWLASGNRAAQSGETRTVDPYGLAHVDGVWYLVAHDHARQARRNFRLDRMDQLKLQLQTFERPSDFQFAYDGEQQKREIVVRVLFSPQAARWVQENRSFFTVAEEERADGLLVTLHIRQLEEVMQWLLSWGRQVRVLEPDSLRTRLLEEAQAMTKVHQKEI
ncbi:MAG: YafY family protein [Caldilineaceae bacterium]